MKKTICLIDITHENKLGLGSDLMPLQVGLVGSYTLKEHGDLVDVVLTKFISEVSNILQNEPLFIAGASNYLWNIDITYKVLSRIKEISPTTITVMGGPNYPDVFEEQIAFLEKYPNLDFYVYKDGEVPFANLVGHLLKNSNLDTVKKAKLRSVHALVEGKPYFGELEPRLRDLTAIPSPYTTGLMDKFFEEKLIPAIQTNRGCPFTCTFCTEGSRYYTKVFKTSFERKKAEIDYISERVKHTTILRVTDSNFGMFEEDVEFAEHIGEVQIGENVNIGCNTSIARGSLKNTIIGNNVRIDNLVQIAHNVQIGNNCIIASQSGIAGSTIIGNNVIIGGQVGIAGHLKIGNNVKIAGKSGVIKNVQDNSVIGGYPAQNIRDWHRSTIKLKFMK